MEGRNEKYKDASHSTVFRELLDSDLPAEEKTLELMRSEGSSIVSAGMETTKWVLCVATFYVLSDPDITARLKTELLNAWPDIDVTPTLAELEKLPYLTAVIQEGLFSLFTFWEIVLAWLTKLQFDSTPPLLRRTHASPSRLHLSSPLQIGTHTRRRPLLHVILSVAPFRDHISLILHLQSLTLARRSCYWPLCHSTQR